MKLLLAFSNSLTAVKLFFYKSIYGRAYAHLYGLDVALNILAQCKTTPLDSIFQSPEASIVASIVAASASILAVIIAH